VTPPHLARRSSGLVACEFPSDSFEIRRPGSGRGQKDELCDRPCDPEDVSVMSGVSREESTELSRSRLNRPITTRFDTTLWMSSGSSPMTLYRTICVRTQGKIREGRQGCSANGPATTTVRPISDEKRMLALSRIPRPSPSNIGRYKRTSGDSSPRHAPVRALHRQLQVRAALGRAFRPRTPVPSLQFATPGHVANMALRGHGSHKPAHCTRSLSRRQGGRCRMISGVAASVYWHLKAKNGKPAITF
jgi:hypothetical protein